MLSGWTPKRPAHHTHQKRYPSSRTSSGTASPCPAHFGPGLHSAHPYQHSHSTHEPSHLHTPIDLHEDDGHQRADDVGHDSAAAMHAGDHMSRPGMSTMSVRITHPSDFSPSTPEWVHSDPRQPHETRDSIGPPIVVISPI